MIDNFQHEADLQTAVAMLLGGIKTKLVYGPSSISTDAVFLLRSIEATKLCVQK